MTSAPTEEQYAARAAYSREYRLQRIAENAEAYTARRTEIEMRSVRKHADKRRARAAVSRAIKSGKLVRPTVCHRCNATGVLIEASHDDYDKPLMVEWLCRQCHGRKDRKRS